MTTSGLTSHTLLQAVEALSAHDPDLAAIAPRHGAPPLWAHEPGFPTLVLIIFEQQVSLASAAAAFRRLETATGSLTPRRCLNWTIARCTKSASAVKRRAIRTASPGPLSKSVSIRRPWQQ